MSPIDSKRREGILRMRGLLFAAALMGATSRCGGGGGSTGSGGAFTCDETVNGVLNLVRAFR